MTPTIEPVPAPPLEDCETCRGTRFSELRWRASECFDWQPEREPAQVVALRGTPAGGLVPVWRGACSVDRLIASWRWRRLRRRGAQALALWRQTGGVPGRFAVCSSCGWTGSNADLLPDQGPDPHPCGLDQCPECRDEGCICCCLGQRAVARARHVELIAWPLGKTKPMRRRGAGGST